MESITADLHRGIRWVVLPFAVALLTRLMLERGYFTFQFGLLVVGLVVFATVHTWLARKSSPLRIRAALLTNFVAINLGYVVIGIAMNSFAGWRADDLIYAIDRAIFHGDPQRFIAQISAPWLSTATMIGYLAFGGFLFYLFLSEAFGLSRATGRLQLGLMRLYGIGFSIYVLLPAAGPTFHHPQLLPAIQHSRFSAALQPWVLSNCSHVDVCPSIHAALCAFTLIWTYRRRPWLFWCFVPFAAALLLGTVYLQYHYVLDVPFGLLLGVAAANSVSYVEPRLSLSARPGAAS